MHVVDVVRETADKEVFVLVHKTADGAGRFLDGVFARQGAALFLLVRLLRSRMGQHHQVGQLRRALFHHRLVERGQRHSGQHDEPQQRGGAQPQDSGFEFHDGACDAW
ncbi:hypothetical protein D3C71_1763420 [compost metagenome]